MPYAPQHLPSQLALLLSALITSTVFAQQAAPAQPAAPSAAHAAATPAAAAPAPAGSQSMSSSLGLYVFPAKNQTADQQSGDEASCFGWAKSQTNIDPMNIKAPQPAQPSQEQAASSGGGERVRGAARGAAGGAIVGAITGNAGEGAAVGAAVGTMAGGAAKRRGKQQAAAEQQHQQAVAEQQAQAYVAQQKATYNKAFSACMEGKGYTVK
jgi:hypothetical protein